MTNLPSLLTLFPIIPTYNSETFTLTEYDDVTLPLPQTEYCAVNHAFEQQPSTDFSSVVDFDFSF